MGLALPEIPSPTSPTRALSRLVAVPQKQNHNCLPQRLLAIRVARRVIAPATEGLATGFLTAVCLPLTTPGRREGTGEFVLLEASATFYKVAE